jgi:rhodanese-related sulfurtransferase
MNINHENSSDLPQNLEASVDSLQDRFEVAHAKEENAVATAKDAVKDRLPFNTPTASVKDNQATAYELKSRLNWGEPGLTIVDVRDRNSFAECSIQGAINMPVETLSEMAQSSLQPKRDIYVYGKDDAETATAAATLQQAGFVHVAALIGGVETWRAIGGSVEGKSTDMTPGADAYNVIARLKEFAEERAKERQLNK